MRWMAAAFVSTLLLQAPVERRTPRSKQPEAQSGLGDEQTPTIRVESRLVNVTVNVVDAKGAPVAGLGRDDFQIVEDGKPQKIAVFERESNTPLSIVLAIDTSGTVLTNERLEKNAAKGFVRTLLRDQDELDLMDFSDNVREIVPFTNQKRQIENGLNELQRGDETALYDAVYLGSQRLGETHNDAGRRRVLMLITDGGDSKHTSRYGQAVEQAQRAGAMIYAIIIVPIAADAGRNTGGEHALIQMADDTGGKFYYVEDPKDLEPAFAHVSDDLRTQYVLGYYAPQKGRDVSFRKIAVQMKDPQLAAKYRLRYRSGYYADAH